MRVTERAEGNYRQTIISKTMTTLNILHTLDASEGFLSWHLSQIVRNESPAAPSGRTLEAPHLSPLQATLSGAPWLLQA